MTRTLSVAGNVPELGVTVNQGAAAAEGETPAVNVGEPELAFTEIVCADGSVADPD